MRPTQIEPLSALLAPPVFGGRACKRPEKERLSSRKRTLPFLLKRVVDLEWEKKPWRYGVEPFFFFLETITTWLALPPLQHQQQQQALLR